VKKEPTEAERESRPKRGMAEWSPRGQGRLRRSPPPPSRRVHEAANLRAGELVGEGKLDAADITSRSLVTLGGGGGGWGLVASSWLGGARSTLLEIALLQVGLAVLAIDLNRTPTRADSV
jgi:hypothetical protein